MQRLRPSSRRFRRASHRSYTSALAALGRFLRLRLRHAGLDHVRFLAQVRKGLQVTLVRFLIEEAFAQIALRRSLVEVLGVNRLWHRMSLKERGANLQQPRALSKLPFAR